MFVFTTDRVTDRQTNQQFYYINIPVPDIFRIPTVVTQGANLKLDLDKLNDCLIHV